MLLTETQRIKFFLDYLKEIKSDKKMSVRKLENALNISNSYIQNTKTFNTDARNKLSVLFPELNIEWLMTGNGEMLRELEKPSINSAEELNTMALLKVLFDEIAVIKSKLEERPIEGVVDELEKRTKLVASQLLKGK